MSCTRFAVLGLKTIPEIKADDSLAGIIVDCAKKEIGGIADKDIIVITSKIISKALNLLWKIDDIKPGRRALKISRKTGKDPKWVQMIFDRGHEIVAVIPVTGVLKKSILAASEDTKHGEYLCEHEKAVFMTRGKQGRLHTCDAGIDGSNHPAGILSYLPDDPDKVARELRKKIKALTGKEVAIILADTEIVPFGTMDFAVGSSGIEVRKKEFGRGDNFGKAKFGGMDIVANELTCTAALICGQTDAGVPVAIIRGYDYQVCETENIANTLIPIGDHKKVPEFLKEILAATACVKDLRQRVFLRVASWFI